MTNVSILRVAFKDGPRVITPAGKATAIWSYTLAKPAAMSSAVFAVEALCMRPCWSCAIGVEPLKVMAAIKGSAALAFVGCESMTVMMPLMNE